MDDDATTSQNFRCDLTDCGAVKVAGGSAISTDSIGSFTAKIGIGDRDTGNAAGALRAGSLASAMEDF